MSYQERKGLAHRNTTTYPYNNTYPSNNNELLTRISYGVPTEKRMLTRGVLNKKHDIIRSYLVSLGLTAAERELSFHLLRLYSYYGKVYPKADAFTIYGGCSKRSFWRTVQKLEQLGVVDRINRYLNQLQISTPYRLDKLVLCLIPYLAEHGQDFRDRFSKNMLRRKGPAFWRVIGSLRVRLRDPIPITNIP